MYIRAITLAPLLSLLARGTFATSYIVNSADDLIAVSNKVNAGTSFSGTTIYLNADLDFSGKSMEPIGGIQYYTFKGSFDGKGHKISNLAISSSMNYGGLIGNCYGTNFSNLVLDSSCSIYSTGGSKSVGVIGFIQTYNPVLINNIVNMASISQQGPSAQWTITGGIVGMTYIGSYDITIKNCVNYGTVTDLAGSTWWSEIGGILGDCHFARSSKCYLQNCANYGLLRQKDGSVYCVAIGGIVSICQGICQIDNCVNMGSASNTGGYPYKGGIIGYLDGTTSIITNNYWSTNSASAVWRLAEFLQHDHQLF